MNNLVMVSFNPQNLRFFTRFPFSTGLCPQFPWNCACPSRVGLVFHCKIDSFCHQNILNLCQCEDELGLQKLKLLTGNMEEKSKTAEKLAEKSSFGIDYVFFPLGIEML